MSVKRGEVHPRPIWQNFIGLFRAVDKGNAKLDISRYNGGLFAPDEFLEHLNVPDDVCQGFKTLADYEYGNAGDEDAKLIDVEILGHIFEQSISDLEELQKTVSSDPTADVVAEKAGPSKRKKEGAFYTPDFITRYIVAETLGPVLRDRFERLRAKMEADAKRATAKVLSDPTAFEVEELKDAQKKELIRFWEAWLTELEHIRIVDPSCGSGAFLIEAFEQMFAEYKKAMGYREQLAGKTIFDIQASILTNNLFGMDLNGEAVEIARLSCWIKTAEPGKPLTSLDANIIQGNSVVDPTCKGTPLELWRERFPAVFKVGGFDVVIGNPPYVRQEWIKADKPYLESHFKAFDGVADLYVYFYELGLMVLKPGGRLGFISSNSFLRTNFAENLRKVLVTEGRLEQVIDLGDTQVFEDAKDVYPAILVISKNDPKPSDTVRTIRLRRGEKGDDIRELVENASILSPIENLDPSGWQFDNPAIGSLRSKLMASGKSLGELVNGQIYLGLKTGLNDAFVVDEEIKQTLLQDGRSSELIKPFIGGQHVRRWHTENSGNWLIMMPSGFTSSRCGTSDPLTCRAWLKHHHPAIEQHLSKYEAAAIKRTDQGEFWWELRACDYYDLFERPKIIYPDIAKYSRFVLDRGGVYSNNTTYFLPSDDSYLLGVLNSDAIWFILSGISIPFGERAGEYRYRLFTQYIEKLPIPDPTPELRCTVETVVALLVQLTEQQQADRLAILDWLRTEFGIEKPTQKLAELAALSPDEFVAEVKKIRGRKLPLTVADIRRLKEEHQTSILPMQANAREALTLETRLSDLVNEAYGLTPEEVALMWETAPPRMPIIGPLGGVK